MDIFNLLNIIGGLSLFLYGMSIMGNGLSKMTGGKLETILEKLTTRRIFAVLLGAGVTAVIQSSSATTVINKGLVLTRDVIMDKVWGTDYEGESRTIDMHVKTLRQKLGNYGNRIKTIRNVGYAIE